MKPSILAIRSIGAELANRIYLPVAVITCVIIGLLFALAIWLTTLSDWWWLFFILLLIAASVVLGVLAVVKLIIRSVTPAQSKAQKKQTKAFVDKLQRLSEVAGTPKFILLFQIVRDIAAPRENGFIASISNDTSSLKHEFIELRQTFK
jgi:membrane protein implicated in regulation of membrane protease activity